MPLKIKVKINSGPPVERIFLKAKKTIDGNIIVSDHPDIDIIIYPSKGKLVTFAKEQLDDETYDSQNRLFKLLTKRGVCDPETVQAGNLFMSMESEIPDAKEGDKIQYLLYVLHDFVEEELPFYKDMEQFEKEFEQHLLEPEVDEYTEFDPEKYHREKKGAMRPQIRPYGISSIYRI